MVALLRVWKIDRPPSGGLAIAFVMALVAAIAAPRTASAAETVEIASIADRLLRRWAPVYVQHVAEDDRGADRPTRIDFDGDWDATNNWDHQRDYGTALPPAAYGAAILTETHAYLTYTLYYPRDWNSFTCVPLVCHDNDLETAIVVIERDGGDGRLVGVRVKAHQAMSEDPEAALARGDAARPLLRVEPEGHGITVCRPGDPACAAAEGRIIYAPGTTASAPPETAVGQTVRYELVSLRDTLWARRHTSNGRLWTTGERGPLSYSGRRQGRVGAQMGAAMAGARYAGGVTPPWALAGGEGERGDWFLDPAATERYVFNPFLDDLRAECTGPLCLPASSPGILQRYRGALSSGAIWLACSLAIGAIHVRLRRSSTGARSSSRTRPR